MRILSSPADTQGWKAEKLVQSRILPFRIFPFPAVFKAGLAVLTTFFFLLFVFLGSLSNLALFDKALEWIIYIMVMWRSGFIFPGSHTL